MQQVKTWPCIVHLVKKIYQIILNFGTHMAWLYIPWGLNMWHFESRWLLSFFSLQSINFNLIWRVCLIINNCFLKFITLSDFHDYLTWTMFLYHLASVICLSVCLSVWHTSWLLAHQYLLLLLNTVWLVKKHQISIS
jgi:hypothetical protein